VVYGGDILALTGEVVWPPRLTIANGTNLPIGIAPKNYFRRDPGTTLHERIYQIRNCVVRLPYISAVNDAEGTLTPGCYLKSNSNGKPVKFVPGTDDEEQKVGRFLGKEVQPFDGWLQWVTSRWGPSFPRVPRFLAVPTAEAVHDGNGNAAQSATATLSTNPASSLKAMLITADNGNRVYLLSHKNVSGLHPVDVWVGGVLQAKNYESGVYGQMYQGVDYVVDLQEGTITFSSTLATTVTVQASYHYELGYDRGIKFDSGQIGLTDDGTPAIANVAGAVGILWAEFFVFATV